MDKNKKNLLQKILDVLNTRKEVKIIEPHVEATTAAASSHIHRWFPLYVRHEHGGPGYKMICACGEEYDGNVMTASQAVVFTTKEREKNRLAATLADKTTSPSRLESKIVPPKVTPTQTELRDALIALERAAWARRWFDLRRARKDVKRLLNVDLERDADSLTRLMNAEKGK